MINKLDKYWTRSASSKHSPRLSRSSVLGCVPHLHYYISTTPQTQAVPFLFVADLLIISIPDVVLISILTLNSSSYSFDSSTRSKIPNHLFLLIQCLFQVSTSNVGESSTQLHIDINCRLCISDFGYHPLCPWILDGSKDLCFGESRFFLGRDI